MARSKTPPKPEPELPQVPAVQGIQLIEPLRADELLQKRPIREDEYSTWELLTGNHLEKAFGRHSPSISSVMHVGKYGSFPMNAGEQWWENLPVDRMPKSPQNRRVTGFSWFTAMMIEYCMRPLGFLKSFARM